MSSDYRDSNPHRNRPVTLALPLVALLLLAIVCIGQTPTASPPDARGVIRLRVRIKVGDTTRGLSRKRFFLIKGSLEQNKSLIDALEQRPAISRDCYYRGVGASEALIKWLRESDCESVYCREIEQDDVEGAAAVPEFKLAAATGEKEFGSRELGRRWLTVNLAENIRDGFYKRRQEDLQTLIKQAEAVSGMKVLSVMTDTRGTAYFTDLQTGTYVVSNMLPTEIGSVSINWNCEVQVKPGDLATEKPFLVSNTREKNVKCVGVEKPLPVCEPVTGRASVSKRITGQPFGVRWQAQRDTALDVLSRKRIQSAVAASLCRRTP